ncbi:MAG: hypothetical protein JXA54_15205 [Candidatus Heimdallarchaeota archaeon]|nr:hypothetical protein [Candidatus Heimdallarchaeota archaeon]
MNKKVIYAIAILSLLVMLPAYSGTAAVQPEMMDNQTIGANTQYDYDGNTIEIIEQTTDSTRILLNNTYQLDLTHNSTNVGVVCTKIDSGLTPQADAQLFDVDFRTDENGQELSINLPDFSVELENSGPNADEWDMTIIGPPEMININYNTTSGAMNIFDGLHVINYDGTLLVIDEGVGPLGMIVHRINETAWDITSPAAGGIIVANWNAGQGYFCIQYVAFGLVSGPIPNSFIPLYADPIISIVIDFNGISITWAGVTIYIHAMMLVLIFDYIILTWYFGFFIERLVILIWDITIIIYITIIELLMVIIYYTFEIKIYYSQIVIVYEFIEIVFVFISILIWEITFIFHFEFWWIQLIFIINVNIAIVLPIRFIFIPIIIPVFIPIIYYVPVYILNTVHIYVPYASPALFIDVYDEILGTPTHTIQYKVTDQAGLEVDDATVEINYNGTDYPATFEGNGIYEVSIPASEEPEFITVTATKSWYPIAVLNYRLDIDWMAGITTITETPTAPLPIVPVLAALSCLALGTIMMRKRKN